jgi:hypothetical protein
MRSHRHAPSTLTFASELRGQMPSESPAGRRVGGGASHEDGGQWTRAATRTHVVVDSRAGQVELKVADVAIVVGRRHQLDLRRHERQRRP